MRGEKGFALVLTLVVTALMVAVAAEMIHQVYVDTSISRGFRDGQQASLLAESGIYGGKRLLDMAVSGRQYSNLSDSWAKPFKQEDEVGSIEITVVEEDGKINLNGLLRPTALAPEPYTMKILKRLGTLLPHPVTDPKAWDNLAAWLDAKSPPVSGGADTPHYMTQKPPYKAHKGSLATIEELSLVKGFTPEIVADLRPLVTVYSKPTAASYSVININTAPRLVLAALGEQMSDSIVERVMEYQKDPNNPFKVTGEFSKLRELDEVNNGLKGMLGVQGNTYRITSVGRVKDSTRTIEAVVQVGVQGFLSWREY
jgi:general secretion pathway protein K